MSHRGKTPGAVNCFNPLKKSCHSHVRKGLRFVMPWMCSLIPEMTENSKVCDSCRKELSKMKNDSKSIMTENFPSTSHCESEVMICGKSDDVSDTDSTLFNESLKSFNDSLVELGESPIDKKKCRYKKYSQEKAQKINFSVKRKFLPNAYSPEHEEDSEDDEIVNHLINAYQNCKSRTKKIMLLTLLPDNWSIRKTVDKFRAPNYQVRQAKNLLKHKGILSTPEQRPGKNLSTETAELIKKFYESDEVSRPMPGIKDCISMKDNEGKKVKVSKRLLLCNLKEAYQLLKEKSHALKVGFSKFAELRPKNCILAGQSGTHSVCVCTIHQNVKLMIENSKMCFVTDGNIKNYKDCFLKMMCNPPSIDCYFSNCVTCPGIDEIKKILEDGLEENLIETVTFRKWISVDRCNLETLQKTANEFVEIFCDDLKVLLRHDFIAKQQSTFMTHTKENLSESEVAVVCDFSENYSFVLQDEAQSYHWNSAQATVHPFVIYYREENNVRHFSFVIISDCLQHNTVAVHLFQKKLINFLKSKFKNGLTKIFYFSDGSAAQYKNKKNFLNLCCHERDFGIHAEWHFSATAHGKGPCDGVGGTVKREAARKSLQRPYEQQITTPLQLYEWAKCDLSKTMNFTYVTQDEYIANAEHLAPRFNQAMPIPGTQKLHAFIPSSCGEKIYAKAFSFSSSSTNYRVISSEETLKFKDMNGYVISIYNERWWLSYVLEKNEEVNEVKVTFLHPPGPSPSFSFPSTPDVLCIPYSDIIYKTNPITPTGRGRAYTLPVDEKKKIAQIVRLRN